MPNISFVEDGMQRSGMPRIYHFPKSTNLAFWGSKNVHEWILKKLDRKREALNDRASKL